jgi:hypothetical protein
MPHLITMQKCPATRDRGMVRPLGRRGVTGSRLPTSVCTRTQTASAVLGDSGSIKTASTDAAEMICQPVFQRSA